MRHPRGVALAVERLGEEVQLSSLNYGDGRLQITLLVEGEACRVSFDKVMGIRMLEEGDLLEYWAEMSLSNGWLFQLTEGGWLELESNRSGFMASSNLSPREFLIVTHKECISVLSVENQPDIEWDNL